MKKRNPSTRAFSLVELSVALGVIVFCLLTIIGLLAVGITSTHSSTVQTSATNILTAVSSDLEAIPNVTPNDPVIKGTVAQPAHNSGSPIYGLFLPAGGAGATSTYKFYVGDNGLTNSSAAAAFCQVNIWVTASSTNTAPVHQETFAHVLVSWPAAAQYTNAQGYVENVVAINRT